MTSTVDLGSVFATQILSDVIASTAALGLAAYGTTVFTAGVGVPIMDCCNGLLWVRIDNTYPTGGDGTAFQPARIDFDIPAFVYAVHVGFMWCHQNLDEQGNMIDPAIETANAQRDRAYAFAIYDALLNRSAAALKPCALGWRLAPFTPLGPDGGCSGGSMLIYIIAASISALV